MSNVIDFPTEKRKAEKAKEDEHFEFALREVQEGVSMLLHEFDQDDARIGTVPTSLDDDHGIDVRPFGWRVQRGRDQRHQVAL